MKNIQKIVYLKILILEINEEIWNFLFWYLKRILVLFLVYKTNVFIKLFKLILMITIYIFFCFLFFIGLFSFIYSYKHLLRILLSLEFIVLRLFFILFFYLNLNNFELYFSMYFLTFSVCEGVLGLSILVSMIRTHGNDYFLNFSMLQC